MAVLSDPYALSAFIFLSLISTVFLWIGLRRGDVAKIFIGVGTSIPTLDILDWRWWLGGAAVCVFGYWFGARLEST